MPRRTRARSIWDRPASELAGHVAGELFKMMAGVEMVHVPYRGGGPVMTDLLGGQVQVLFGSTSLTIERSGPASYVHWR